MSTGQRPPGVSPELWDAWWTIVKNSRDLNDSGHARAVRWARAGLGFDEHPERPTLPFAPTPRLCPSCKAMHPVGTTCEAPT